MLHTASEMQKRKSVSNPMAPPASLARCLKFVANLVGTLSQTMTKPE